METQFCCSCKALGLDEQAGGDHPPLCKAGRAVKHIWEDEVEERPQLIQVVLHWRPCTEITVMAIFPASVAEADV